MKNKGYLSRSGSGFCLLAGGLLALWVAPAIARAGKPAAPVAPGSMLDQGIVAFDTPDFTLRLVKSSQTVASLKPKGADGFDFTPGDRLAERCGDGFRHLGDLEFRVRSWTASQAGKWREYSTATSRAPVMALPAQEPLLAQADLGPTLPPDCPLVICRGWSLEEGKLVMRFELKNRSRQLIEIGGLAMPMVFNNVLSGRELDEAHAVCSFTDPYIGGDAGYVQVTRLNGRGPALLVVPEKKSPLVDTPLESWSPLLEDPTPRGHTFEGFYSWVVHSLAYAENEWKKARPWNPPTSLTLAPGETRYVGVRFLLSPGIREIESTLAANGRPLAVGIPGYILPMGTDARLFLRYSLPVRSLRAEPGAALAVAADPPTPSGWRAYTLRGRAWGRARLLVTYGDGLQQAIHCFVIKPQAQAVADLGRFLFTRQWFVDDRDPFGRSPSIMTYDRERQRVVLQDNRVWIAGLGDEGGSSWLAGALKLFGRPDAEQAKKYEEFIDKVLWGGLQRAEGEGKYGVRKSLFYYQPDQLPPGTYRKDLDWSTWTSWDRAQSESLERSFDYPHVAALHWAMYRLARNCDGLLANHPWQWYLENARQTVLAMLRFAPDYSGFGNMEGSVFLEILRDLEREGMAEAAAALETRMRERYDAWRRKAFPFGSEMPWDSTGQEEVHAWSRHFGDAAKARACLDAILGYMPALPHWGYNGSARRYWDFLYAGKVRRVERQLHHYGSGLNAIPVLDEFRRDPGDLYLLRVGYAGAMGALANIDRDGFASCAFHSFPDTLRFDPLSGDFAQNFFGHAMSTAAYLVRHREFGWLAFGGSVNAEARRVTLVPSDSFRRRIFIAPLGLWLTLDAGNFMSAELDPASGAVRLRLDKAGKFTPAARLRLEQPARIAGVNPYSPSVKFRIERGAYVVPLKKTATWVELSDR